MATAGLAITLAYLALDRFRYRKSVEHHAQKLFDEVGEAMKSEHALDALSELRWLCGRNETSPTGAMPTTYNVLFRNSLDVTLIVVGAAVCFATLALGTASEIGLLEWLPLATHRGFIVVVFAICIASALAPMVGIVVGRKCMEWGTGRVPYLRRQLEIVMKAKAELAQPPV